MAEIGALVVRLRAQLQGFTQGITKAKKDLTGLGTKSTETTSILQKNSTKILAAGAALATAFTVAAKKSEDYSITVTQLKAASDLSAEGFRQFKVALENSITTVPINRTDQLAAAKSVLNDVEGKLAVKVRAFNALMKAQTVVGDEVKSAMPFLIRLFNEYRDVLPTKQIAMLNELSKITTGGFGDLSSRMKSILPLIKGMGGGFNDVIKILAFADTGFGNVRTGMAQVRTVLGSLRTDTAEAQEAFRLLGVKGFDELIEKEGGLLEALKRIIVAGEKNTEILTKLGLTETQVTEFSNGLKVGFDKATKAGNELQKSAKENVETFNDLFKEIKKSASFRLLQQNLGQLIVQIGEVVSKALNPLLSVLVKIGNFLTKNPIGKGITTVITALTGLATAILVPLAALAKLKAAFGLFPKLLPLISSSLSALAPLLANPATWGIVGAIAAIALLRKAWKADFLGIRTHTINSLKAIKTAFTETFPQLGRIVLEGLKNAGQAFLDILPNAFDWGKKLIENFIAGIRSMGGNLIRAVKRLLSHIVPFLKSASPPKEGPLKQIDRWGAGVASAFVEGLTSRIREARSELKTSLSLGADTFGVSGIFQRSGRAKLARLRSAALQFNPAQLLSPIGQERAARQAGVELKAGQKIISLGGISVVVQTSATEAEAIAQTIGNALRDELRNKALADL